MDIFADIFAFFFFFKGWNQVNKIFFFFSSELSDQMEMKICSLLSNFSLLQLQR